MHLPLLKRITSLKDNSCIFLGGKCVFLNKSLSNFQLSDIIICAIIDTLARIRLVVKFGTVDSQEIGNKLRRSSLTVGL